MQRLGRRRPPRATRAGFSLLEVMFAAAVLAIAISGAVSAMISAMRLDRVNRETTIATLEARSVLEQMQNRSIDEIYAAYNQSAADDVGAVPGSTFVVAGLDPDPADPDGIAGQVIFPEVLDGGVWELREDVVDTQLGMPMDIGGAAGVDADDHSGDYRLLPVRLQVRWSGVSGPRSVNLVALLARRE